MYKNVGNEIKSLAAFIAGLYAFGSGIIGFVLGSILNAPQAVIVLTAVCAIVGYIIGRLKRMMIYAYGEIACRLIWVDEKMNQQLEQSKGILNGLLSEQPSQTGKGKNLDCMSCGAKNNAESKFCNNCGCIIKE